MKSSTVALEFLKELIENRTKAIEDYRELMELQREVWKQYMADTNVGISNNINLRGIAAFHPEILVQLFTEAYDARVEAIREKAKVELEALKEEVKGFDGEQKDDNK